MKSITRNIFIFILTLTLVQSIFSQKAWEKDWQKWDQKDAQKVLNESPWVFSYTDIDISLLTTGINKNSPSLNVASPYIVLRWYSALTTQKAMLRLNQISQKYDSMTEKQKLEFDEKNSLNCGNCKNYYVLFLMQPAAPNTPNLIGQRFKSLKFEDLKNNVYLTNDKGEKRELAQFVAPKDDTGFAVFYFERLNADKKPLIISESKKVNVIMELNSISNPIHYLQKKVEFNVQKMIINGEIDF